MTRLYVDPDSLAAGPRTLSGDEYHYLFRVRRLRPGDRVTLFDGQGREALATIETVGPDSAVLAVEIPRLVEPGDRSRLTVIQALIKGERMDLCVQKLVELGVDAIIPVQTERTVVRLSAERARKRHARFVDIARDAARQSSRARVPQVHDVLELEEALARVAACELKLVFWEREKSQGLRAVLPARPPLSICALIGPEGGFTAAEIEQATSAGFACVGLGPYILRAETAAIAVAAVIGSMFGDLAG